MGKNLDKIGKLEDFSAPWETDAGETEIDKDRLKKYIFGLSADKAKAQDAREAALEAKGTAEAERDEAKAQAEKGGDPNLQKELETERGKTQAETERANKAERELLVTNVAVEKGLTPAQAKRLQGTTEDELKADADELLESFGGKGNEEDGDKGGDDLHFAPRPLHTPGTPVKPGRSPKQEPDFEAVALERRNKRMF